MKLSQEIITNAIAHRRHLHAHPELSGQEFKTAEYIQACLDKWGVSYEKNIGGLGIVAWIGPETSDCLALRADMDALPICETNTASYQSTNAGVMHACGHDVHMACLLEPLKRFKATRLSLNAFTLFFNLMKKSCQEAHN